MPVKTKTRYISTTMDAPIWRQIIQQPCDPRMDVWIDFHSRKKTLYSKPEKSTEFTCTPIPVQGNKTKFKTIFNEEIWISQ